MTAALSNDVTERQRRASDPSASAWVAANAGSGKTYVLVQRILRLLLDGTDPSRILALTYTKAAAANMANRVFKELGEWIGLSDFDLSQKIEKLDGQNPNAIRLAQARRLFARAIETPGGIKIQTIHAFCERLLHLVPFEANVAARFEVLDDQKKAALIADTINQTLKKANSGVDRELTLALGLISDEAGESGFEKVLKEALAQRTNLRRIGSGNSSSEGMARKLRSMLTVFEHETASQIRQKIYNGRISDADCVLMTPILFEGLSTDISRGQALRSSIGIQDFEIWFEIYGDVFFKSDGLPRDDKNLVTKQIHGPYPQIREKLALERDRINSLLHQLRAVDAYERTWALMRVVDSIFSAYNQQKARAGFLDFDDLIERTLALLERADAQWVLYKLDKGIDHILIDEAQDTSPDQWEILKRIAGEFFDGHSARNFKRTVFAVGDPKQSIYSFQGADPAAFSRARDFFSKKINGLNSTESVNQFKFHDEKLTLSFRSTPDVLRAVDQIFSDPTRFKGLESEPVATSHETQRFRAPGLVEIWPSLKNEKSTEPESWASPLDETDRRSSAMRLAHQVSRHIQSLIGPHSTQRIQDEENPGAHSARKIRAGDIIILVRNRNSLFEAIIRALKDAGIPVAGADRLKLTEHIAIMDLMALGRAMLSSEDDLTLAALLRSPLMGMSEDALCNLANGRSGSLRDALFSRAADLGLAGIVERLDRWQALSSRLGPFGFYANVLGPDRGRQVLVQRLGPEAGDAIDTFLSLALDHERMQTPSLHRFLTVLSEADLSVKRDMDAARNEVRVMTVHGAKGLEAPIVYLPDTCGPAVQSGGQSLLWSVEEGETGVKIPIWSPSKKRTDNEYLASLRTAAEERARDEHRRLLYVALTRPRDRLYISGFTGINEPPPDCWYTMIKEGLSGLLVTATDPDTPDGALRLQSYNLPTGDPLSAGSPPVSIEKPDWLERAAPSEPETMPPLRPSSALSAANASDRPFDSAFARDARRRGNLVHSLLQTLPEIARDKRAGFAQILLKIRGNWLTEAQQGQLAEEVVALISAPELAALFGPESKAEIAISGSVMLGEGKKRDISAQIDRLAVTNDAVFIADYKTAARAPERLEDIPETYIAQLALYRALLVPVYPDRRVVCLIVYTAGPRVFTLSDAQLDLALVKIVQAASLDA
jgi:ATP-dependent helicase/nuclease subunit A